VFRCLGCAGFRKWALIYVLSCSRQFFLLCNSVIKLRHATYAARLNFCLFHDKVKFIVCIVLNGMVFYETKMTKKWSNMKPFVFCDKVITLLFVKV
jgi:hypothetical protein